MLKVVTDKNNLIANNLNNTGIIKIGTDKNNLIANNLNNTGIIKIGTYNIQKCSTNKINIHKNILSILINLYDVVFIQELQKNTQDSDVVKLYNNITHTHILSELVGRNTYKERYCYIYNKTKVKCIEHYLFDDKKNFNVDCFERDPYVGKFSLISGFNKVTFYIVGCHTKPTDSLGECNMLDNIAAVLEQKESNNNIRIIILGDLNAGTSYIKNDKRMDLSKKFYEITNGKIDTMVSLTSNNAHDRIYCTQNMTQSIVCFGVINMEHMFDLTNNQVRKISDHYPLEVSFYF